MDYHLLRYLGESLGSGVNAGLTYLFLAYQVIVSVLVFLFDSGFPPWLVIVGWVLLLITLAAQVMHRYRVDKRQEKGCQQLEQLRLQRISRLKERLKTHPGLQTPCRDCRNGGGIDDFCRVNAGPAEKKFRFQGEDSESYCLLWFPK